MRSDFTLAYAKYTIALENDSITDEIRTNLCKMINEKDYSENDNFCGLLINSIFRHYSTSDIKLAKEECLKLNLGPRIPNIQIFSKCLDFLSLSRNKETDYQVNQIRDLFNTLDKNDQYTKSFNRGILDVMLQRLLTLMKDGKPVIVIEPELSNKIIKALEDLNDDSKEGMEFIPWYIE